MPSSNQVEYYFLYLFTGKHINTYHWEELLINDKVTIKVEQLKEKEKKPTLVDGMPIFESILCNLIDDEEGDMIETIQNVEDAHAPFIEKEIVDDVYIVENKVGEIPNQQ